MDIAELTKFAAYGIEKMIEELKGKLAQVHALAAAPVNKHPRDRPPKALLAAVNGQGKLPSGWPADPEERKREMARRMRKWGKHALETRAKLGAAQRKSWAGLSVRDRKKRVEALVEGRRRAKAAREAQAVTQ